MIKKICLLTCHNQYDSKRYFSQKLAEAFERQHIQAILLNWEQGSLPQSLLDNIIDIQPDLTASFHPFSPDKNGHFFWDQLKIPHWNILVDPAFYDLELMSSPYSRISCVDKGDCFLLASYQFKHAFFFPHAVERELIEKPPEHQPIDVIMLGTCYDPDHLYKFWQSHLPEEIVDMLEDAVSIVLSSEKTNFVQALLQSLISHGLDPSEVEFDQLAYYVDNFSRGIDRLNLIRSIKNATVHVYGGTCWREEQPIANWSHYLAKQANVTIHPPVSFEEALKNLKQSKICLNSMPFFKQGTHERIFSAIACGAIPLTTQNTYLEEFFTDESEVLYYRPSEMENINDKINALLANFSQRKEMILRGQAIILDHHTWDQRVKSAIQEIEI